MDIYQAIVLALVQGLTEFLPISSSAHLILPSKILGWPDQGLAFDVAVHVGTLAAVMIYFRTMIVDMMRGVMNSVCQKKWHHEAELALAVVIGVIPAGIAGLMLDDFIETQLRSTLVIALATIGFGVLLGFADLRSSASNANATALLEVSLKVALLIGLAQAFALIPGTSRSGVTITAGLLLGLSRDHAARFSFLLSIPLILAAGLMKSTQLFEQSESVPWVFMLVGVLVSGVSAYLCIHWFLRLLDRISMMPFVIYRLLLGAGLLFML